MSEIICPDMAGYFFGDQFLAEVANRTLLGDPAISDIKRGLSESISSGVVHKGLWLVNYLDVDTGLFMCVQQKPQGLPSMISFFARSNHRFFGGTTLVCVPFQFCMTKYKPEGDYLVYRHTFKEPKFTKKELQQIKEKGTSEQYAKALVFTMSRVGYKTIPGMSYVGMTKRSWQERYAEHAEKALKESGSTLFHQAIRNMEAKHVIHVHDVSAFGLRKNEAKEYEKALISKSSLHPNGLNMKVG